MLISPHLSAETTVRSASEYDYPPLALVTNGEADGFSVDLLRATLTAVEMDVSYYVGSWSEIKQDLAEGRIDALPLVGRTPERELLYDFSVPYLTMYGAIFVKEGNSKITSIEDLTDKKIVVMEGDNSEEFIRREHLSNYITTTKTFEEAFRLVSEGKQDAVITQRVMGIQLLKNMGIDNIIPIAEIKTFKQDFTFAVKQGNKELLTQLNDGLSKIIVDGTYDKIYHKWFDSLDTEELNVVNLTSDEKDFIKSHPIIRIGTDDRWEPYVIKKEDNTLEGFDVELTNYINAQTGTNIQIVTGPWSEMVEQAKEHKIDGLTTSSTVKGREVFFNFSDPYVALYPVFVVPGDSKTKIDGIDHFAGKSVAILKGNQFYLNLLGNYPEVNIIESESEMEAIKLTIEGKAAAAIVATTSYNNYHKIFTTNIKVGYVATQHPLNLVYSVRKDWPELTSIINKGLASLSLEAKNQMIFHWFGLNQIELGIERAEDLVTLTASEKAWINKHPEIRLGVDPNWHPYEYVDENGQLQGIVSDYIGLLNRRLGIDLKIIPDMSWLQLMEAMPERGVDVFSSIVKTPEREKYLSYTDPYLLLDWVIVRSKETPSIKSLEDFEERIVAVADGYATKSFIEKQYPKIQILPKATTYDVLQSVVDGKADAALVERVTANMIIHSYRMYSLEIDQQVIQKDIPLSFAVRSDLPELVQILNKGLSSITPEESEMIAQKWMAVPIQIGFTGKDVLRIVLYVFAVMGIFLVLSFFWNRRLKKEILKRNKAEKEIDLKSRELEKQLIKSEKQRIANLVILKDLNKTTKDLKAEIKERKQAEQQIQYQANLLANVSESIFATDRQFNIQYWNTVAENQYGWTPAEVLGNHFIKFIKPQYAQESRKAVMRHIVKEGFWSGELIHNRRDGTLFPVQCTISKVYDAEGQDIGHITITSDITERKQVEKEIQMAQEEIKKMNEDLEDKVIERTQQLEASIKELEAFSYSISHDLRAPLRAINGFTKILVEDYGSHFDEEGKEITSVIANNAVKMGQLIDDLIFFTRIGRVDLKYSKIDMEKMIQSTYYDVTNIEERQRIDFEIHDLENISGDHNMLKVVWKNLISNAVKFTANRETAKIEIYCTTEEQNIIYHIKDNGVGFDMRYIDKLFGVFQRLHTDEEFGGTGVGLALIKRIILQHKGNVWAKSELDKGAEFSFSLPDRV